jgi:hypothetical protein
MSYLIAVIFSDTFSTYISIYSSTYFSLVLTYPSPYSISDPSTIIN